MMLPAGFSLLELVMVLLLMSMVLVVATPRWPTALLLGAQAERLAQDIRYTQALAMQRGQRFTIRRTGEATYTIVDDGNQPVTPAPPPLQGVAVDPFVLSFTAAMGEPEAAGPPIRLTMGEESVTLRVTARTGTVLLQP
ncbi:MAG: GspH/FimT family pseudopilin [Magnetococcus sp. DMHC-8]